MKPGRHSGYLNSNVQSKQSLDRPTVFDKTFDNKESMNLSFD